MPRIPAGRVTESGTVIPSGAEKETKKKKVAVPQDWKKEAKQKRFRKKARSRR